jgi:hypothetical protein
MVTLFPMKWAERATTGGACPVPEIAVVLVRESRVYKRIDQIYMYATRLSAASPRIVCYIVHHTVVDGAGGHGGLLFTLYCTQIFHLPWTNHEGGDTHASTVRMHACNKHCTATRLQLAMIPPRQWRWAIIRTLPVEQQETMQSLP